MNETDIRKIWEEPIKREPILPCPVCGTELIVSWARVLIEEVSCPKCGYYQSSTPTVRKNE